MCIYKSLYNFYLNVFIPLTKINAIAPILSHSAIAEITAETGRRMTSLDTHCHLAAAMCERRIPEPT